MNTLEASTTARKILGNATAGTFSFGAQRAARRLALSAAVRSLAEGIVFGNDAKGPAAVEAALADLLTLEISVARKNQERFHN